MFFSIKRTKIYNFSLPSKVSGNYWITDDDHLGNVRNLINVEAEDGTITVYTEPTDLHKALEALRANGQEEFQVTELEMIPQTEVTLEGEDLEVFEGLIDALEADDDVQKVYHNVADM